ncbi:MAG: peptidylprolyl isomerase [Desulfuromonas sp.]|nr:peptidylprolyl isomerase [Desulfuromonas sp.]
MFIAKKGDTVSVHYTGRLSDGTVFDTSKDKEPLQLMIGKKEVIEGFDEALIGMVAGESKTITIPAAKAYGAPKPGLIETIKLSDLPEDSNYKVGAQIEITKEDGGLFYVMVVGLNDETITLDANHPLAGKDLTFEINVEDVTPEKVIEDNPLDEILGRPPALERPQ